ncbi:hypothetical protein RIF29_29337 [Crotalaria pallida]|uniref:Uncharacterized protein n=1 Tax=Crotalaria pallida TaxID=3830 RepID=A0AAN9HW71_CROPI
MVSNVLTMKPSQLLMVSPISRKTVWTVKQAAEDGGSGGEVEESGNVEGGGDLGDSVVQEVQWNGCEV